ncbi:MAG TPA: hypothetical protein PLN21_13800 [Gemmatales bacterium]|nr:hypothetical protein [Gemmatales bacterium]
MVGKIMVACWHPSRMLAIVVLLSGGNAALNHRLIAMTPPGSVVRESPIEARLERVTRIWDKDPHSAFTDLIWWKDRFVCVFRAGSNHVSDDGTLQLLSSEDGQHWDKMVRLSSRDSDLRDPKILVGTDNELYILASKTQRGKQQLTHQSTLWEVKKNLDGKGWSTCVEIGEPDSWLWRITRHKSGYYGWGYGTNKERFIRLYKSPTGQRFDPITPKLLADTGYPNETAMIMEGDQAWCLLRRDGKAPRNTALLGTAKAPFTEWTWRDLGVQIGGPAMLRLPSGQFLVTVRLYDAPKVRTALCQLDVEHGKLKELLTLPSSGDSSYAGMVWHQQKLWISYYSSHETKSSIYFAEVDIKQE